MIIYFASDFHLGIDGAATAREREQWVVQWLREISKDADRVFLVGDLFDFWFEYKHSIPKGHTRFLGQLAAMRDAGIPIEVFTGNHDMWMFDYLEEELDLIIHKAPIVREWNGKRFMIGHGDGLGPGDQGYKRLKKVFASRWAQWLFGQLHPNLGIRIARYWSGKSRAQTGDESTYLGDENEWLFQYCEQQLKEREIDYFIFGHRHLAIDRTLSNGHSRYINLGEWLSNCSYARFDGNELRLLYFQK